jgi:hypothetical protein
VTRYLANWEVESDIIVPEGTPFVRYDHPAAEYTVFLRNIPGKSNDTSNLSMQFIFDAPSLKEARETADLRARQFLDFLSLGSNLRVRLRNLLNIFDWEPGNDAMRECYYFARPTAHDDAPYDYLGREFLDSIAMLQAHSPNPRLRRAMKWFGNGVATKVPDDQFAFFWFVVELIAQMTKDPEPVPDKCPKCHGPLHCPACGTTPHHRPYQKQAIEQLFLRICADGPVDGPTFYRQASGARNMLMHGDEVKAIEASLDIEFSDLVDTMGKLAWMCIVNQFAPVLVGKKLTFFQADQYVYMNLSGAAHMQVGFVPNFDNPDPAHFPKVDFSMVSTPHEPDNTAQE